ncbi:MAG: hypothetical protein ACTSX7_19965 [Alphaproteobacteria bacterium]
MTHTEAFTQAKDKEDPDSNEDRFLAVPDCLYAVIDGATDKSGRSYDGLTGGQIAARILEDVLRNVARCPSDAAALSTSAILGRVNRRLRRQYHALGITDVISKEPWCRFSAQASIAIRRKSHYRFIVVGDTGLRINAEELFSGPTPGDIICAQLRVAVHRYLTKCGAGSQASGKWSRAYTVEGLRTVLASTPGGIGATVLKGLCKEAREASQQRLPGIAAEQIDGVLMYGLKGLHHYRNQPGPLGFPCIDGSPVPRDMIVEFERPAETIECFELFSDGYSTVPRGTAVADWEADFWKLQRDDPQRINSHPETKGSTDDRFADDRTVLIVHPQAGTAG